jgi:hypothetical protein
MQGVDASVEDRSIADSEALAALLDFVEPAEPER